MSAPINHIVVGMNFGDEGKGQQVHKLCTPDSLVIRFSGGHQAGHTVVDSSNERNRRHVFSHFGAGTFKGIPTYWSKYCTFYPTGMLRERFKLIEKGTNPILYIDPLSPVTTPFDVIYNQAAESQRAHNRHGSVGVGVGTTFERHDTTPLKLFAKDLYSPSIYKEKLFTIRKYYLQKAEKEGVHLIEYLHDNDIDIMDQVVKVFIDAVDISLDHVKLVNETILRDFTTRVFEGSQGILLDQDHGVCFPHVTRAHTTCRNAIQLIKNVSGYSPVINMHYMTRSYLTRHGRGQLLNECSKEHLLENGFTSLTDETNVPNSWQETLRYAMLNSEYFLHSIRSNIEEFNSVLEGGPCVISNRLHINCLDQLHDKNLIPVWNTDNTKVNRLSKEELKRIADGIKGCFFRSTTATFDIVADESAAG